MPRYFQAGTEEGRRRNLQPFPAARGPERALDPGLEEDPDAAVELVDGIFYRASHDDASVAITADYPGLLPSSRVSQAEDSILRRGLFPDVTLLPLEHCVGFPRRGKDDAVK